MSTLFLNLSCAFSSMSASFSLSSAMALFSSSNTLRANRSSSSCATFASNAVICCWYMDTMAEDMCQLPLESMARE